MLFVCTGNSARSQMAEAVLRHEGGGRFEAHSAGTRPRGVHPLTLHALAEAGVPADGLRSKSIDEYLERPFDYVITVCDRAREACPVFPGARRTLHWGLDDPAEAEGSEEERLAVFRRTLAEVQDRVRGFTARAPREARGEAGTAG